MDNTLSSALILQRIGDVAVPLFTPALAPLQSFGTLTRLGKGTGMKSVLPRVVGVADVARNPVNFEEGDSIIAADELDGIHLCAIGHASSADIQGGLTTAMLAPSLVNAFAQGLLDICLEQITEANFSDAVLSLAPEAFGTDDMASLMTALRASGRTLCLDTKPFAAIARDLVRVGNAWAYPGFDSVNELTNMSAAGSGIIAFTATPQAMAIGIGAPELPIGGRTPLASSTMTLAALGGIQVAGVLWANPRTRTTWVSIEAVVAAKPANTAALKLVKSI